MEEGDPTRTIFVPTNEYPASEDDDIRTISPANTLSPTERGTSHFVPPHCTPQEDTVHHFRGGGSGHRNPSSSVDPSRNDAATLGEYYPKSIATSYEHRDQLSFSGYESFYATGSASFVDFDAQSTEAAIQRGTDMAYDEVASVMGHTVANTIATKYTQDWDVHPYEEDPEVHSMPIPILPTKGTDLTCSVIAELDYDVDYRRTTMNPSAVKPMKPSTMQERKRRMMICFILLLFVLIFGAIASGVICTLGVSCQTSSVSKSSSLDSSNGSSSLAPTRAPFFEFPTLLPVPRPSLAPSIFIPPPMTKRPSAEPTRSPIEPEDPTAFPTEPPQEPKTEAPQELPPPTDRPQEEPPPTTDRPQETPPATRRPSSDEPTPSPQTETMEPSVVETVTMEPTSFRRPPNDDFNPPPSDDDR